jgi:hypothetical protein
VANAKRTKFSQIKARCFPSHKYAPQQVDAKSRAVISILLHRVVCQDNLILILWLLKVVLQDLFKRDTTDLTYL